jgi:hypothetical protein
MPVHRTAGCPQVDRFLVELHAGATIANPQFTHVHSIRTIMSTRSQKQRAHACCMGSFAKSPVLHSGKKIQPAPDLGKVGLILGIQAHLVLN